MLSIGIANSETTAILQENIDAIVKIECKKNGVEEALVKAIIKQESQYKPYSARYEKHLKKAAWYMAHIPDELKDNKLAYCSMGCMQVMYGTARWLCFQGTPDELMNPWHNIKYGVQYIKWLTEKYYRIDYVISAYNQGSPRKSGGKLKNYDNYVKPVLKYYAEFGGVVK